MLAIVWRIQSGQVVTVRNCVSWRKEDGWEMSGMGLAGLRDENNQTTSWGTTY
jgi:hypothetical protein